MIFWRRGGWPTILVRSTMNIFSRQPRCCQHLPEIIYSLESFDQDLCAVPSPVIFAHDLAADYVKVILTGEGADELLCRL